MTSVVKADPGPSNQANAEVIQNADFATKSEAKLAIAKFTHAVERRMKPALDAAILRRDDALRRLAELEQCRTALELVQLSAKHPNASAAASYPGEQPAFMETRVNLGEEFYVQAHVFKSQPLVVDVGIGVLVEMSLPQVSMFYGHKGRFLQHVVDSETAKINEIRTNLEEVASNLAKLKTETATADFIAQVFGPSNNL